MKRLIISLTLLFAAAVTPVAAYVGPGAGFAFAGSFLFIFAAFFLAIFNFLTFPIRALIKFLKRMKTLKHAKYKRAIIIGFDGMDYKLFNRFIKEGKKFPNFEKVAEQGAFAPLLSTEPPISPVAWSTFSTGVNPGKHNIFDFLTTDRNTYMPKMACSDMLPPKRNIKLGPYVIPLSKPRIELRRKSKSFWSIVAGKGISAAVMRVPFTFPPEKFPGVMLSGLGTPDLRGSQGSFTFYSDQKARDSTLSEGICELLKPVEGKPNTYTGYIKGPPNPFNSKYPLFLTFTLVADPANKSAAVTVGKESFTLEQGKISPWMTFEFRAGFIKVAGIGQWVLENVEEGKALQLYLTPLNIDPARPSMPISHPRIFSVYLAKLLGSYATLGMAEDTWALSEGLLSEEAFIDQVYNYHREREKSFFDTLKKYKSGLVVQVFEATDRIQHMFWRYMKDSGSPAPQPSKEPRVVNAIYECYKAMDDFLGELMKKLKDDDLLMIVSDHGFSSHNRGFHLNTWLRQEGYLVLKPGKEYSNKWYADIDWSKSRAYGQGLNGIFLNLKGREKHGIVDKKEAEQIKDEIKKKLLAVRDVEKNEKAIAAAYKREEIYRGPYTQNAPDIVIGYETGYRVSWESAVNYVGRKNSVLFSDNVRLWSGDHAFTKHVIPGIFFSNREIKIDDPTLADISPTVLSAFGIKPPSFIDGRDLQV
jgi:predicted AlkP superfamily phosphohydrolase/phosphomutase